MKVVLDTNIIVSQAISTRGASASIFRRWRQGGFLLLVSDAILDEYSRTLARTSIQRRTGLSVADVSAVIAYLKAFATAIVPEQPISGVSLDPDDDMFLECALAGSADYIVSGDRHLLALDVFRGIPIVPPALFLLILDEQTDT